MDWNGLQVELGKLMADAKDVLDSRKFWDGSGTDEPHGVTTGMTTAERVTTSGSAAFAIADVYKLKEAPDARFMANAAFAIHPTTLDVIYRFAGGGSDEPQLLPDQGGPLLGKRCVESTSVGAGATGSTKLAVYADWKQMFLIADRIGSQVELVPHLFGSGQRPSGQRGLFMYWRTGSKVIVKEAGRYLEVA